MIEVEWYGQMRLKLTLWDQIEGRVGIEKARRDAQ